MPVTATERPPRNGPMSRHWRLSKRVGGRACAEARHRVRARDGRWCFIAIAEGYHVDAGCVRREWSGARRPRADREVRPTMLHGYTGANPMNIYRCLLVFFVGVLTAQAQSNLYGGLR